MCAYYVMLASKDRDACLVQTTVLEDISGSLTRSFVAGFVLNMINLIVNTFVEPCVRIIALDGSRRKPDEPRFSNWFIFGFASDIVFRLSFFIFSIGQIVFAGTDGANKCSRDKPELAYDFNWLRSLATTQLLFIPAFLVWRHYSVLDLSS